LNNLPVQKVRQHSADGHFCFGAALSLADVCLVPQLYQARRYNTDLIAFPTLAAINNHLEELAPCEITELRFLRSF
jgi:glutathione S-transferase